MQKNLVFSVLGAFLLLCAPMPAQPFIDGGQTWDGGWPVSLSFPNKEAWTEGINAQGRVVRKELRLGWISGPLTLGWGNVWGIRPTKDSNAIYRFRDNDHWEMVGRLPGNAPARFLPISDDCILALTDSYYEINNQASRAGIFKRKGEDFELVSLLQFVEGDSVLMRLRDLPKAAEDRGQEVPNGWRAAKGYGSFDLQVRTGCCMLVALPEGGAIINMRTGNIWVLSPTGTVSHRCSLYEIKETDLKLANQWDPIVLGAVPTSEGHVLMAARKKDEAIDAVRQYPYFLIDPKTGAMQLTLSGSDFNFLRKTRQGKYQSLTWWDFDPGKGKFSQLEMPPFGCPERIVVKDADRWDDHGMNLYIGHDQQLKVDHSPYALTPAE